MGTASLSSRVVAAADSPALGELFQLLRMVRSSLLAGDLGTAAERCRLLGAACDAHGHGRASGTLVNVGAEARAAAALLERGASQPACEAIGRAATGLAVARNAGARSMRVVPPLGDGRARSAFARTSSREPLAGQAGGPRPGRTPPDRGIGVGRGTT